MRRLGLGLIGALCMSAPALPQGGDAEYGKELLEMRRCTDCHALAGEGGGTAPDLATVGPYSAVEMASTVWTHGPNMQLFMDYLETGWPQISEQEIADLIAYLNN